ncbi:hypothetical protein DBV05_g7724 [Lasiodiplodia theobromae]|uniref:Uncharacterized protein n=1 Tax=Lasiodiplodia theobromae TaxID=45133 RepID=A0A5N5D778_9PEZI|nr:hypothetical protein DBV05_g7724 [Lasiodiplodia theobromae]
MGVTQHLPNSTGPVPVPVTIVSPTNSAYATDQFQDHHICYDPAYVAAIIEIWRAETAANEERREQRKAERKAAKREQRARWDESEERKRLVRESAERKKVRAERKERRRERQGARKEGRWNVPGEPEGDEMSGQILDLLVGLDVTY